MRLLNPLPNEEMLDISKDDINRLLYESFKKCDTAVEEVAVLKELAKINGHYEKTPSTQINVLSIQQNKVQLETMTDAELLEFVGEEGNMFELPSPATEPVKVVNEEEVKPDLVLVPTTEEDE